MGLVVRLLWIGLLLLTASGAVAAPAKRSSDAAEDPYGALVKKQPMIFLVAKGGPDSCGPGCSEWIAAEGAIDTEAAKRFQDFVESLPRRDLPVYFSSIGGVIGQSMLIAQTLRDNRMTAGVGRTIPEGCAKAAVDDACRRVMQSKREHKAGWSPKTRVVFQLASMHSSAGRAARWRKMRNWASILQGRLPNIRGKSAC